MINSKFLKIIKTLDKNEFKELGKFVRSPVYNTNKSIIKLFDYLKLLYPRFRDEKVSKEIIFKLLHPREKFNDKSFRNISSEMLTIIENFLLFLSVNKDNSEKSFRIFEELSERGLVKIAITKYNDIYKSISKIKYPEAKDYYLRIRLNENIKSTVYSNQNNVIKKSSIQQAIIDDFIKMSVIFSKDIKIELSLMSYINTDFINDNIVNHINDLGTNVLLKDDFDIQLRDKMLSVSAGKDKVGYNELLNIYTSKSAILNIGMKAKIRSVLLTYLLDNKPFVNDVEYYENYLKILGHPKEHIINGYIRDNVFTSYIIKYLYSNQHTECLNFFNRYNKYLNPKIRKDVVNFNLSKFFLFDKSYRHSLEHAMQCGDIGWWYIINNFSTIAICYYELGYYDKVPVLFKKYRGFLNKDKRIEKIMIIKHNNFIKHIEIILKLYKKMNLTALLKLKKNISNSNNSVHSNWLLEKIEELEKKSPINGAFL